MKCNDYTSSTELRHPGQFAVKYPPNEFSEEIMPGVRSI